MIYGFDLHTTGRLITLLDFMVLLKHTDDTMHITYRQICYEFVKGIARLGNRFVQILHTCMYPKFVLTYSKQGGLGFLGRYKHDMGCLK